MGRNLNRRIAKQWSDVGKWPPPQAADTPVDGDNRPAPQARREPVDRRPPVEKRLAPERSRRDARP